MLTSKQMAFAEYLCANPHIGVEQAAADCGIGTKTGYVYRHNPEFQAFLEKLCREKFKALEALAIEKLKENVEDNQEKAIEYVLNGLGYKPEEKQEVSLDANITIDYGE